MNDKKIKLRPPTDEELAELFRGIIQENHDHPILKPIRARCNDCIHRIPRTSRCNLLYPNGIPNGIFLNKETCENFKAK